MKMLRVDVLIAGAGTGGCAAAIAVSRLGRTALMVGETDWIGGQLTEQAVPPDEHPWIERFGCTQTYRDYRDGVRAWYRVHGGLRPEVAARREFNPGGGWVSRLCHLPAVGLRVLESQLAPWQAAGRLEVRRRTVVVRAEVEGDRVRSVVIRDLDSGEETLVEAAYFLDATEMGDLLPLTGTEYVTGAESAEETGEPHAVPGPAEPDNIQGLTWCFALAHDEGSHRVIDRPAAYDFWRAWRPEFWPGPLLGFQVLHAHTLEVRELPLYGRTPEDWYALFPYRQLVEPALLSAPEGVHPVTLVNWPQNDYFLENVTEVDAALEPGYDPHVPLATGPLMRERLLEAKELSRCLLYWLQTEAPRHDGGSGYPGLYVPTHLLGTEDGFAKTAYIRESRRIRARFTVREQDVSADAHPGADRAPEFADSVGIGAYRLDLHPSCNGANTIDTSSLPFQIPLGSLLPVRMRNLLPACKNLGVTHLTNGCYRLHPIEWNIGEAAGALAAFCLSRGTEPHAVGEAPAEFQRALVELGVELAWPRLRAL